MRSRWKTQTAESARRVRGRCCCYWLYGSLCIRRRASVSSGDGPFGQPTISTGRPSTRHLVAELDEAIGLEDDGRALGKLLDQFLWWEVRSEVQRLLGIEVRNGNGG